MSMGNTSNKWSGKGGSSSPALNFDFGTKETTATSAGQSVSTPNGASLFAQPTTSSTTNSAGLNISTSKAADTTLLFGRGTFPAFGGSIPALASRAKADVLPSILRKVDEAPDYGNDIVTVIVGPDHDTTTFVIHDALARSHSDLIDDHFKSGGAETKDRVVCLPEHEAEHFRIFHNFIYGRHIYSGKIGDFDKDEVEEDKEWGRLAKAYALGDHLKAPAFKDAVTDAVIEKALHPGPLAWATPKSMHEIIYAHSKAGAGLRRLLVDLAATRWTVETLEAQKKSVDWADFFFDLSMTMRKLKSGKSQVALDKCQEMGSTCVYHDHGEAGDVGVVNCYKVKYSI
ncbi:hypothetical protein LTR78_010125 [Recurvomyces mirabilis]|uniref:BTB domain-containing protein n=1 Tax=Recurvomyces mirabilis TaxID=574656 RepID=A0AAE0WIB5_9PEZI|nr:hypothetical protein LTR78_010125 [Recurvomyces mirabilis]KAK5149916.1 hypothetical protein LTS14_010521 [Recurvomyces mirabilis]